MVVCKFNTNRLLKCLCGPHIVLLMFKPKGIQYPCQLLWFSKASRWGNIGQNPLDLFFLGAMISYGVNFISLIDRIVPTRTLYTQLQSGLRFRPCWPFIESRPLFINFNHFSSNTFENLDIPKQKCHHHLVWGAFCFTFCWLRVLSPNFFAPNLVIIIIITSIITTTTIIIIIIT